eukprot:CAMPEP_0184396022 /NCGR_PEP_ID=MMETSP0007-20130409/46708_1 /TAXON_ID=97485 /ORGANISM="Prymnesium parvum, Strain Texoma1" /LENGTH=215 /DNA_ID=CAMNT_0026748553 /DNA_START=275 /DNA_END=922 /DNA_ORIENTATION=+
MDTISISDLGLESELKRGTRGNDKTIYTQSIVSNKELEMVIFLLPKHAVMPFHDHPSMTVFSKVIYGSLSMVSVDWKVPLSIAELKELDAEVQQQWVAAHDTEAHESADGSSPSSFVPREVVLRANTVLTSEAPTCVLRPDFANIHMFLAQSDCAVLDVLMPPYDEDDDRDCHYFELISSGTDVSTSELHLRPIAEPSSLVIRSAEYMGPTLRQP